MTDKRLEWIVGVALGMLACGGNSASDGVDAGNAGAGGGGGSDAAATGGSDAGGAGGAGAAATGGVAGAATGGGSGVAGADGGPGGATGGAAGAPAENGVPCGGEICTDPQACVLCNPTDPQTTKLCVQGFQNACPGPWGPTLRLWCDGDEDCQSPERCAIVEGSVGTYGQCWEPNA